MRLLPSQPLRVTLCSVFCTCHKLSNKKRHSSLLPYDYVLSGRTALGCRGATWLATHSHLSMGFPVDIGAHDHLICPLTGAPSQLIAGCSRRVEVPLVLPQCRTDPLLSVWAPAELCPIARVVLSLGYHAQHPVSI